MQNRILLYGIFISLMVLSGRNSYSQTTYNYIFTGAPQTYNAPNGGVLLSVTADGARGGPSSSPSSGVLNLGGRVTCSLSVPQNAVLNIYVGGMSTSTVGGYNGGGAGMAGTSYFGGGGGGASDMRLNGTGLANRVVVAGGGGGDGQATANTAFSGGGGLIGQDGTNWLVPTTYATGGTQTAGGNGGTYLNGTCSTSTLVGQNGVLGIGGNAVTGTGTGNCEQYGGSGGGGGYYGGGGMQIASAGGGSSYTDPVRATNVTHIQAFKSGDGEISFTEVLWAMRTQTNVNCNGLTTGAAAVTAGGTAGPITYSWIPSGGTGSLATGLAAGNYTCIVTSPAGIIYPSFTITQPLAFTLSILKTNATCFGSVNGSATVTPGGGNAPYTYTWLPSGGNAAIAASLAAGNYTVNATNVIGCPATATVAITQPGPVSLTATASSPTVCNGSSIILTATGANTYTWTTGVGNGVPFVPLTNATATVTGTNAATGCTATTAVSYTVIPVPTITPAGTAICSGSTATLTANGASSYNWNTGATTISISVSPVTSTNYTVTGTSAAGCTNSAVFNVTVNPTPTLSVNSPTICLGNSATLTAGGAPNYSWSTGATTSTILVSPVSGTTYTLTGSTAFCSSSVTATVSVGPPPNIIVNSPTICPGFTATLIANGATSYTWNTTANTSSISVTPAATTIYSVTGITIPACAPVTQTTSVFVSPTPTVSVNSETICSGYSATLTATGANTYTWSTGATTSSILAGPPSSTVYNVTGTSGAGCVSALQSVTVTVNPTPTLVLNSATICEGKSATLTVNGAANYTWSTMANTASISVSPVVTTVYSVTGTSIGCASIAQTTVFVNPNPTITATSSSICLNHPFTFTASGATSYSWTGPGTYTASGANAFVPNVDNLSAGIYVVTGSLPNTCTSVVSATLTALPLPTLTVGNALVCLNASATLPSTVTPGSAFLWTGPSGDTHSSQNAIIASAANVSPVVYTLVITGPNSCTNSATSTLATMPLPTVSATGSIVCLNQPYIFTGSGASSYTWAGPNTLFAPNTPTLLIPNVDNLSSGNYTLIGTGTNGCVNMNLNPIQLSFMPLPNISVTGATVCSGKPAVLTAAGGIPGGYSWAGPANFSSISTNATLPSVNQSLAGVYTVTGMAANSCTNSNTATLVVMALPQPVINAPSRICMGSPLSMEGSAAVTQTWTGPFNFRSLNKDLNIPIFNLNQAGSYSLAVTDNNGCVGYTTAAISIDPQPTGNLVGDNTGNYCVPFCSGFHFASTGSSPVVDAVWQIGNNAVVAGMSFSYCLGSNTITTVTGTFTNALGCSSKLGFNIEGAPRPVADFVYSPTRPSEGYEIVVFRNTSRGDEQIAWSWHFANKEQYSGSGENVSYTFDDAGVYAVALIVTNKSGCSDTVVKSVVIEPDFGIYVPNSFTPDGDGLNDTFHPKGRGIDKYNLTVFNRLGNVVFQTSDFNEGWDGSLKGRETTDDIFVWKITITDSKGRVKELTGHITIIR